MITVDEIRKVLTGHRIVAFDHDELDDDTPLVLDSLALVWLLHVLEEEYGIVADPEDHELDQLTSVRGIHEYLRMSGSATAVD